VSIFEISGGQVKGPALIVLARATVLSSALIKGFAEYQRRFDQSPST
jgi:hypothetical protein